MRQTSPDPKLIFGLVPIIILLAFPGAVFAPEYLSPGVFIEEINSGPKPIEGVTTPTAGSPDTLHVSGDVKCTAAPTLTCEFGPTSENYVNLLPQTFEAVSPDGNTKGHVTITGPPQALPTIVGNDLLFTPESRTGNQQSFIDPFFFDLDGSQTGQGSCSSSHNPGDSLVLKVHEIGTASFDVGPASFDEFVAPISTYPGDYDAFIVDPNEDPASGSVMNQLEQLNNRDFGSDQLPNMDTFSDGFESGDISVWSSGSSKNEQPEPAPWLDNILDRINPVTDAVAAKKPAKRILKIRVRVPVSKGYVTKFKLNRNKKNWHDPAAYIDSVLLPFVIRKWIVGESMYVSINIPIYRQYPKDEK